MNRMHTWRQKKMSMSSGKLRQLFVWVRDEEAEAVTDLLDWLTEDSPTGAERRVQCLHIMRGTVNQPTPKTFSVPYKRTVTFQGEQGVEQCCHVLIEEGTAQRNVALVRTGALGPGRLFPEVARLAFEKYVADSNMDHIQWFDVAPQDGLLVKQSKAYSVTMTTRNGLYNSPTWTDCDPNAWPVTLFDKESWLT